MIDSTFWGVGGKKFAVCTEGQVFSALTKWIPEFLFKAVQKKVRGYNAIGTHFKTVPFFTSMYC